VEEILAALDQGTSLDGCEEPMRVHLACWQVLQAAGDTRAPARLQAAREQLLARAARVGNAEQRESYLQRVPHHRALLQA
jgi:hypothetical protein